MNMNEWTIVKDSLTLLLGLAVAVFALWNYRKNGKTRRAEFLVDLHQSFFVEQSYKHVRRVLDSDSKDGLEEVARLVEEESEESIDFLNFFELVAYLEASGNISQRDRQALLGYYLGLIRSRTTIRRYVMNKSKSFEHLSALLAKIG